MNKYGKLIIKDANTLEIIEEKEEILCTDDIIEKIPFVDIVVGDKLYTWVFRDVS